MLRPFSISVVRLHHSASSWRKGNLINSLSFAFYQRFMQFNHFIRFVTTWSYAYRCLHYEKLTCSWAEIGKPGQGKDMLKLTDTVSSHIRLCFSYLNSLQTLMRPFVALKAYHTMRPIWNFLVAVSDDTKSSGLSSFCESLSSAVCSVVSTSGGIRIDARFLGISFRAVLFACGYNLYFSFNICSTGSYDDDLTYDRCRYV